MTKDDRTFLKWIHARLEKLHGENPNTDYMQKLKSLTTDPEIQELRMLLRESNKFIDPSGRLSARITRTLAGDTDE